MNVMSDTHNVGRSVPVVRPPYWLRVALSTFVIAWGGNQATSMLVFYRGSGEFADLFVDLLLAVYAVAVAVGLLLAGSLADRIGRRIVVLPLPILAACGSLLIACGEHSEVPLMTGRICAGLALGAMMSAGGSWIKELSALPFDPTSQQSSGAKRASLALTAGLAAGPGLAGVLAQWAVWPGQLIYLIHIALAAAAYPFLLSVPETRWIYAASGKAKRVTVRRVLRDINVPELRLPRFLLAVLPISPWVFGCSFTAQAILTSQIQDDLSTPVAFAALISVVTMAAGFGIQQLGPRIDNGGPRGFVLAMTCAVAGMALAMVDVAHPSAAFTVLCAVVLGVAYGLCLYVGLAETQRLASPDHMAGLTGIFYTGTYVGMMFPAILTFLSDSFSYVYMLGFGVVMAVLILGLVSRSSRRQ